MQSANVPSNRHGLTFATVLITALIAQAALADCPPGYRSKARHCIPGPAQPHRPLAMKSIAPAPAAVSPIPVKPHTLAPKRLDGSKVKPKPGAPIEHPASASNARGIIFVGGKQALNPQPIPPGNAALNPQPIPPGHSTRKPPHPGTPVEKKRHWDVKANKES